MRFCSGFATHLGRDQTTFTNYPKSHHLPEQQVAFYYQSTETRGYAFKKLSNEYVYLTQTFNLRKTFKLLKLQVKVCHFSVFATE